MRKEKRKTTKYKSIKAKYKKNSIRAGVRLTEKQLNFYTNLFMEQPTVSYYCPYKVTPDSIVHDFRYYLP